jgi:Domain of unknown function (DUF5078)
MLTTNCTTEQIMAAARDVEPMYYERYMIDYSNHSPENQRATQDQMHRLFAMDYAAAAPIRTSRRRTSPTH